MQAASSSEPPNERRVGVPPSRSLATTSHEATSFYEGRPGHEHIFISRGLAAVAGPERPAPRRIRLGLTSFGPSTAVPTYPGPPPSLPVRQRQPRRLGPRDGRDRRRNGQHHPHGPIRPSNPNRRPCPSKSGRSGRTCPGSDRSRRRQVATISRATSRVLAVKLLSELALCDTSRSKNATGEASW